MLDPATVEAAAIAFGVDGGLAAGIRADEVRQLRRAGTARCVCLRVNRVQREKRD
jgi:hypothetical protein